MPKTYFISFEEARKHAVGIDFSKITVIPYYNFVVDILNKKVVSGDVTNDKNHWKPVPMFFKAADTINKKKAIIKKIKESDLVVVYYEGNDPKKWFLSNFYKTQWRMECIKFEGNKIITYWT